METLNEPTPYDTVIQNNNGADVLPDIIQFSRPVMELSLPVITVGHGSHIATDSAGPTSHDQLTFGQRELTGDMIRTMTSAMTNLTSICKSDETRDKIRQSMVDIENGDGNK